MRRRSPPVISAAGVHPEGKCRRATPIGPALGGHDGARRFYAELLGAFPDTDWELHDVVIGHQDKPFAGVDQVGQSVRWRLNNMFPWNPQAQLFTGEILYYFRPEAEYFVAS